MVEETKVKSKKLLFVSIMLIIGNIVFSFSPKREAFTIWNFTNKNIVVEREFIETAGGKQEYNCMWEQTVYDITLSISDMLEIVKTNVIKPNQYLPIIAYFPLGPQLAEKYDRIFAIPFEDKMNAIFKRLEIIYDDGKTIITLENLDSMTIKKWGGTYILEIYDNDSEIKSSIELMDADIDPIENTPGFYNDIIRFLDAMSLPGGNVYIPDIIPGYTPKEQQALLTHAIEHQAEYQNGDPQAIFEQILKEAALYFQGVNVYRTKNPPEWYLEYEAQRVQNNALNILWK
jgi:hypothetical protein